MKKLLLTFFLAFQLVSLTVVAQNDATKDEAFMNFNYYPEYTLGSTPEEMLQKHGELKRHKDFLMFRKFSFTAPSFSIKNNKVYGFGGAIYSSNPLSNDENPERTKRLCDKYVKQFTDKFGFEPKVEESTIQTKDAPLYSATYTWQRNGKTVVLMESSTYDDAKRYYGGVHVSSSDENLAK